MIDRLRRLVKRPGLSSAEGETTSALNQMRRDVAQSRQADGMPLTDLRPVLIPSTILGHGTWVGPYHFFEQLPVSLTWAFLRPHGTMLYLSHDAAADFEGRGIDWRREARAMSWEEFQTRPWTNEFAGASGKLEAVALMHDDGLGPSRLVHAPRFLDPFPSGFAIFVPERSCALVLAATASAEVSARVERVVEKCFNHADVPMSKSGYRHEVLITALTAAGEL